MFENEADCWHSTANGVDDEGAGQIGDSDADVSSAIHQTIGTLVFALNRGLTPLNDQSGLT